MGEGWTPGSYSVLLQFSRNEDGTLSDIKALSYSNSKTAQHCINVLKHIQRMLPGKNTEDGQGVFVQPITFQIISEKEAG
jgi:hypothetical protein